MQIKVLRHVDRVMDVTPDSRLVDERTGQLRLDRFHVLVPPDREDELGRWYEIRVSWHGPRPGAPRGYVEAIHYGRGCPASDLRNDECWHLYAAVAKIAQLYDPSGLGGKVPEAPRSVRPAPPAEAGASQARPRPTGTDAGFYD